MDYIQSYPSSPPPRQVDAERYLHQIATAIKSPKNMKIITNNKNSQQQLSTIRKPTQKATPSFIYLAPHLKGKPTPFHWLFPVVFSTCYVFGCLRILFCLIECNVPNIVCDQPPRKHPPKETSLLGFWVGPHIPLLGI